jgi:polyisoprenoid-binding protein YceI
MSFWDGSMTDWEKRRVSEWSTVDVLRTFLDDTEGGDPMSPRTILTAVAVTAVGALGAGQSGRAADVYAVDGAHSSVVYRVKHMNTSNSWGRFNHLAGSFSLDEANPAESKLDFQVKTDSIDSADAKRDQHLKSPDFFNAVQYPTIAFKSQSVTKVAGAYEVTGDLSLHGVTKPITIKVVSTGAGKDMKGTPIAGIETSFNIKRSDYGMSKMVGPIGDDVWINVSIEASKK